MILLMEILKICLEEQLLIKYYLIKAFNIIKNPKYHGYQCRLALLVYKFCDKRSFGSGVKSQIMPNQRCLNLAIRQLAEE